MNTSLEEDYSSGVSTNLDNLFSSNFDDEVNKDGE